LFGVVEATDLLESCSPAAKGYLLAALRSGAEANPSLSERLPVLRDQPIAEALSILASLPAEQTAALADRWQRAAAVRIDDSVEVHWTWLVEPLEREPFPLALLLLRELRPGLAKETAKALVARNRAAAGGDLDLKRLPAPLAAHLRRRLFSRFPLSPGGEEGEGGSGVAALSRRDLYLLLQDVGTVEIVRLAGDRSHEVLRRLRGFRAEERVETVDLLRAFWKGASKAAAGAEEESEGSEEERETEREIVLRLERVEEALEHASEGEDVVGLVGLSRVALALAGAPRRAALVVARKMLRPWGERLLAWRDRFSETGAGGAAAAAAEIEERIGKIRARAAGGRESAGRNTK